MAASIITYRFGIPMVRSLRHNLVVEKVVVEGPGIISIIMKGRKLHKLAAEGGQFSRSVAYLKPGTRVFVEGPYGAFTAGRATMKHIVLVGGGVGITPVRALLDEFKNGVQIDLIYRVSREEDLVLKEELDYLEEKSNGTIRVHYLVGSRREHPMDARALEKLVPRVADADIYICGPAPLVEAVKAAAAELGVPKNRFHDEAFEFHAS